MSKRRDRLQLIALAAAAIAAWSVAMYFSMVRGGDETAPTGRSSAASSALPVGGTTGSGVAKAPPTASSAAPNAAATSGRGSASSSAGGSPAGGPPNSSAVPSAAAAPPTAATSAPAAGGGQDATACVMALFAPDTFSHGRPDFSFVCSNPFPRHGITQVQAQVVLGRGSNREMTDGMREWATLGWYQLAAYSVFRGRCCSSPPQLEWTFDLACPIDEAMTELERAVGTDDSPAIDAAVERYTKEARCLTKLGQARNFGQSALPAQGMNSFRMVLERMRRAK